MERKKEEIISMPNANLSLIGMEKLEEGYEVKSLHIDGNIEVKGDIFAEEINIEGNLVVDGLVQAKKVTAYSVDVSILLADCVLLKNEQAKKLEDIFKVKEYSYTKEMFLNGEKVEVPNK